MNLSRQGELGGDWIPTTGPHTHRSGLDLDFLDNVKKQFHRSFLQLLAYHTNIE